jgi:hypothetical protein
LVPTQMGDRRMQWCGGVWRQLTAGVGWRLDSPEVEENQSGQLGRKTVCVEYCCGDQMGCRNGMGQEREIVGLKENCGEEFGLLQFK